MGVLIRLKFWGVVCEILKFSWLLSVLGGGRKSEVSYLYGMDEQQRCRACEKNYIPARRGGKFCSEGCGSNFRQQVTRKRKKQQLMVSLGFEIDNPVVGGELELLKWAESVVLRAGVINEMSKQPESEKAVLQKLLRELLSDLAVEGADFIKERLERVQQGEERNKLLEINKIERERRSHRKKVASGDKVEM